MHARPFISAGKDFLIEALKYHLLKGEQKSLFKTPRTKPRQPRGLPKVLLVVGGQAPKAIRSVECYDFKEEKWYQVSELPTRRCRAGKQSVRVSRADPCFLRFLDGKKKEKKKSVSTRTSVAYRRRTLRSRRTCVRRWWI